MADIDEMIDDEEREQFEKVKKRYYLSRSTGLYPDYEIKDGHLTTLQLKDNIKRNIKIIENFPYLQRVDFFGSINEIFIPDNLPKLKNVSFRACDIKKIKNLENCDYLERLEFVNCKIGKIEGLEKLPNLKSLTIERNYIGKIQNLETLTSLLSLDLSENHIKKIEGLDTLDALESLRLSSNKISVIEGLDNLYNLKNLFLAENRITELQNMDNLNNLETLSIEFNAKIVKNLHVLLNFKYLRKVFINQTQLQAEEDTIEKIRTENPKIEFIPMRKAKYPTMDKRLMPPKFTDKYRPWRHT